LNAFVDTSVLVAAFYPDHEHHERSMDLILRHTDSKIGCAAHTLAEVYASLTAMPGKKRVSGDEAALYLQSMRERLTVIALTDNEYFHVVEGVAALGLSSGAVYDAIIGHCAIKARAKNLFTWNVKHFLRLESAVASRVKAP
jgi:predicted nucleic acid-binding protein